MSRTKYQWECKPATVFVIVSDNKDGYRAVHEVYANEDMANLAVAILNTMDTNKTHDREFYAMPFSLVEDWESLYSALNYFTK